MPRRRRLKRRALRSKSTSRRKKDFAFQIDASIAKEVWAVIYLAASILTYLSITNGLGSVGIVWKQTLLPIFGYGIYFLPVLFMGVSLALFFAKKMSFGLSRIFGIFLLIGSVLSIMHVSVPLDSFYEDASKGEFGGLIGFVGAFISISIFGIQGSYIILIALFLISILLTFQISLVKIFSIFGLFIPRVRPDRNPIEKEMAQKKLDIIKLEGKKKEPEINHPEGSQVATKPQVEFELDESVNLEEKDDFDLEDLVEISWEYPPMDLLSDASLSATVDDKVLKRDAKLISEKLAQFGIEVVMHSVNVGPTVIQYTLKPHAGVKLSKITNLKNDLALALAAKAIRIEAPIPGQSMVGIEIPNDNRSTVRLREILEAKEFKEQDGHLKLTIGRDVAGKPIIGSLAKMPHLLIAGATGAGKSVCVNSFLISLLYQYSPKDLRMIMVDPKRVELNNYNSIPHLLTPVITDTTKANIALRWCVREMNERYKLCADRGHRNIADYNGDKDIQRKMPFIVIVIDELADLMMTAGKEVEASICRIAQMARAVGMHLIVTTQRPSVDVITGLIKANIPARIAFTVASQIDSRTILDATGAEDLLGHGDMLYLPGNTSKPVRVQGTFVSSKEIERVTNRIKLTLKPDYIEEITSEDLAGEHISGIPDSNVPSASLGSGVSDEDDIYNEAVKLVMESRKASASFLQRRLSVGYARAARLLDIMEQNGIVGPTRGAKPRDILVK